MRNETQWKKIRCHRDLNRKKIKWQDKTPKFLTTKPRILPAKQLQNYANESAWPRGRPMAYSAWAPDGRPCPPSMNIHMGPSQSVKKMLPAAKQNYVMSHDVIASMYINSGH